MKIKIHMVQYKYFQEGYIFLICISILVNINVIFVIKYFKEDVSTHLVDSVFW